MLIITSEGYVMLPAHAAPWQQSVGSWPVVGMLKVEALKGFTAGVSHHPGHFLLYQDSCTRLGCPTLQAVANHGKTVRG